MLLERLKLSLTQLAFLPTKGDEASLQVRPTIIMFASVGNPYTDPGGPKHKDPTDLYPDKDSEHWYIYLHHSSKINSHKKLG
jgi:hypothetical protein